MASVVVERPKKAEPVDADDASFKAYVRRCKG
jgi:hypothetical protein